MDNFMDKLAQRLNAQEMIKANSAADAAELERLQKQLAQYDACLQEMRKLSLKNTEAMDKLEALLDETQKKFEAYEAASNQSDALTVALEEQKGTLTAALEEQKASLTAAFEQQKSFLAAMEEKMVPDMDGYVEKANEFVHKENVKVYRNVQAVIVEEAKKQTDAAKAAQEKADGKSKALLALSIVTLVGVLADIAVNLLQYFNIKFY